MKIQFLNSKSVLLSALVATCILNVVLFTASCKPTEKSSDFFYSGKDTVNLYIAPDSIGFIMAEDSNQKALGSILAMEGFSTPKSFGDGMFVTSVAAKKKGANRKELLQMALTLKEKNKGLILKAGYLAYSPGSKEPMLVNDEIVVDFADDIPEKEITAILEKKGLEIIMQNPFIKTQYLVRAKDVSKTDILKASRDVSEEKEIKYAHPNLLIRRELRAVIPNDVLFGDQWHLRNTGQGGGTEDADVDIEQAWDFTMGNANILIAVLDAGFDMTHPDLVPNYRRNTAEIANGIDDDGNGFTDDIDGWDFNNCVGTPGPGCGDNVINVDSHGTSAAGVAAARGNNMIGVSGSCPNCAILPVRIAMSWTDSWADGLAFGYAQARGARVISCSWGYPVGTPVTAAVTTAINNAAAAGAVIFFAMNNINVNDCGANPDISSLPSVIAVSRSTNRDMFDLSGFGNCMDVLAPTYGSCVTTFASGRGTLGVVTTDIQGVNGYNSGAPSACLPANYGTAADARNYTNTFGGTSSATPLTAGIAGLLLSADNTLTPRLIQNLLQDCADKIEHSAGAYSPNTGFSTPAGGIATHGYGRVNAFEAVRIAAPVANGGKGGVDVFFRDNMLDWGNTERPSNTLFEPTRGYIPHYESMDIKIDAEPFAAAPTTSAQFDAFVDERPVGGRNNKVYVRVHNRGYRSAATVTIKLHWVYAGLVFPALPADFWTSFPSDASDVSVWHPLGTQTVNNLGYSGASVGGSAQDASQIVSFDFLAPVHNESTPNHYCLMALADSPQDRLITPFVSANLSMDAVTPFSNNATHRNITINNADERSDFTERFQINNPTRSLITIRIRVMNPMKLKYTLDNAEYQNWFVLKPGETRLVQLKVNTDGMKEKEATLMVQQVRQDKNDKQTGETVMGGITFKFLRKK